MKDLLRDTVFSHTLRVLTGGRIFKYPEEEDTSLWKRYVHSEKSGHMARHGQPQPPAQDEASDDGQDTDRSRRSKWKDDEQPINQASGQPIDKEKGKDVFIVDWYGPNDPEVSASIFHSIMTQEGNAKRK